MSYCVVKIPGPTKKTTHKFNLFWTMVWHVNSDVIVMLTNLREQSVGIMFGMRLQCSLRNVTSLDRFPPREKQ